MTNIDALTAASLWVAAHMLLIWFLGIHVTRLRMKLGVGTGVGDDPKLERAVRAHGNATEHVPVLLVGLGFMALLGASPMVIHILGATLFVARLAHAQGIQVLDKGLPPGRAGGNIVTWVVTWLIALALIFNFAGLISLF
ncbi:MAG: MAPEG family protein [Parvularculales bacterium]